MKSNPRKLLPLLVILALVGTIAALPVVSSAQESAQTEQMDAKQSKDEKKMEANPIATMTTNMGDVVLKLFPAAAPKAVENFIGLSEKGYYEGVIFHRVIDDFMIQGGDPTGTGMGGKSIWELPFEDEFSKDHRFDGKGILAMANAGPKTNGSQFFITLKATTWLNDRHTIFGEVVEGLDIVEAIGKVEVGPRDKPIKDVVIEKVTVKMPEEG
jgi:cyclophilin family peptidyl-prolyl cis-trans isomerase